MAVGAAQSPSDIGSRKRARPEDRAGEGASASHGGAGAGFSQLVSPGTAQVAAALAGMVDQGTKAVGGSGAGSIREAGPPPAKKSRSESSSSGGMVMGGALHGGAGTGSGSRRSLSDPAGEFLASGLDGPTDTVSGLIRPGAGAASGVLKGSSDQGQHHGRRTPADSGEAATHAQMAPSPGVTLTDSGGRHDGKWIGVEADSHAGSHAGSLESSQDGFGLPIQASAGTSPANIGSADS